MNYEEAIQYIKETVSPGSRPGLERVGELLAFLGSPEEDLKIIHVTGTNGKGSVCVMLESILCAAGYRIGLFSSPYIRKLNECIRLNGQPITDERLAEVTEELKSASAPMEDRPTEFELLTAAAMTFFKEEKCDAVICETGMGGRLDATNVAKQSLLSIITNVELDHMAFLGDTIEKIAFEKAGIIKENCPVIFGGLQSGAEEVVRAKAAEMNARFVKVDYSHLLIRSAGLDGCRFDFQEYKDIRLPLLGLYQPYNASVVLAAVSVLKERGLKLPDEMVRKGMALTSWPARFEVLSKDPLTIYDGAHNMAGITVAAESIRQYFQGQKVNLMMGVMADKEYDAMIEILRPLVKAVYAVTPANPRALPGKQLADCFLRHGVEKAVPFDSVKAAASQAMADSREEGSPLIALGTLYMYEEAERAIRECALEEK